jgi:hypothetical protein
MLTVIDRLGFPSARGQEAIRHILVPHDPSLGTQEESASREVEEVLREVLRHAGTRPRESLGVITMASSTRTGYLSTYFKELRNLPKDDEGLRAKGKDRRYVPDPNKVGDLEKLRERSLI